ncbi:MAG: YkuS family protein [bacterium]|jgi:hypothetical protein
MNNKVIAVEESLAQVNDFLQDRGFRTVNATDANIKRAAAVVISGGDKDILGIETAATGAPVINASGLTPEEVLKDINSRLH